MSEFGKQKLFTSITYGCQMNEADTERYAGQLKSFGYLYTEDMDQADVIVINTCCVRESAEKKIYGKIGELKRLKAANPNLIIIVAGCMAQKDQDKLFKKAPHIDLVIGTYNINQLMELIQKTEQSREPILAVWEQANQLSADIPVTRKNTISAWVPIMYGCDNFCTYCIVPYVRGRERSRPLAEIVKETQELALAGFKEITLLGQNVNSYQDKQTSNHYDFADLLQAIDQDSKIERIRYMTSHPRDMSDRVIRTIAQSKHICEQFHLPIQSGSNNILHKMNRGYTTEYYQELVARIRSEVPGCCLTTDLIVGFPGETDEHFEETLKFIEKMRFDAAYTFLYSQRSGTPAASMPEQVSLVVKKERLKRLMDVQNQISLEINKTLEGKIQEVLVEGPSKNNPSVFMGRTRTNKIVLWKNICAAKSGELIQVKIDNAQTWVLKGQAI